MLTTGFIESGVDERDYEYSLPAQTSDLPQSYNWAKYVDIKVKDQGNTSSCVPHSLSTILETQLLNGDCIDILDIYNRRPNKTVDGMNIRDAFKIVKRDGYLDKNTGQRKYLNELTKYFRLRSEIQVKWSLVANGPCILAFYVKSFNPEFWRGNDNQGGHAVTCVGYDEEGFIIQNSWGSSWGDGGYCKLPYEDLKYVVEAWGIE